MIASTKLAKAQRAMRAAKAYGETNNGEKRCKKTRIHTSVRWHWPLPARTQRCSRMRRPQVVKEAASSSLFALPTRVFVVVFTLLFPRGQRQRWQRFLAVLHLQRRPKDPKLLFWATRQRHNCLDLWERMWQSLSTKLVKMSLLLPMPAPLPTRLWPVESNLTRSVLFLDLFLLSV